MRKVTIIIMITGVFSLLTFMVCGIIRKANSAKMITVLPGFKLKTLTGSIFESDSITEGPLLIVIFSPECGHCEYEISEISKSDILLSGAKLLLVTSADSNSTAKFLKQFNLDDKKVIPLLDNDDTLYRIFGKAIVPSIYIYNKKLDLIKALYGEYKIETILKYLQFEEN